MVWHYQLIQQQIQFIKICKTSRTIEPSNSGRYWFQLNVNFPNKFKQDKKSTQVRMVGKYGYNTPEKPHTVYRMVDCNYQEEWK